MCPVFAGRVIRGVKNGPSPAWLQKRLTAIGLRSINRLVDVTNLIAYDRARPLHVYDLAKLSGTEIVVRGGQVSAGTAHIEGGEPEHLIALDGKTYAVSAADCVIADAGGERPIGLGGVIGGSNSEISDNTVNVLLESATFDGINNRATAQTLGLRTEATLRFEKGLRPELAPIALRRAPRHGRASKAQRSTPTLTAKKWCCSNLRPTST